MRVDDRLALWVLHHGHVVDFKIAFIWRIRPVQGDRTREAWIDTVDKHQLDPFACVSLVLLASFSAALRVNALKLSPTFSAASEIVACAASLKPISFFVSVMFNPFYVVFTIYAWDMHAS